LNVMEESLVGLPWMGTRSVIAPVAVLIPYTL